MRQRRSIAAHAVGELLDLRGSALDLDDHPVGGVRDEAGQPEAMGESVHEGAEADSLHQSAHLHADARPRGRDQHPVAHLTTILRAPPSGCPVAQAAACGGSGLPG